MQTEAQAVTDALIDHFAADNKFWAADIEENHLTAP